MHGALVNEWRWLPSQQPDWFRQAFWETSKVSLASMEEKAVVTWDQEDSPVSGTVAIQRIRPISFIPS